MGFALAQAQDWLAKRKFDLPILDSRFIAQSVEREKNARAIARRMQALVAGLIGWINKSFIKQEVNW